MNGYSNICGAIITCVDYALQVARIIHESAAPTVDKAVLPGVLGP